MNTVNLKPHNYKAPVQSHWTGRATPAEDGLQYWYQQINCHDLLDDGVPSCDVAILGYACDEGVRRNQGRVGAVDGPEYSKKKLARLAYHHSKKIADVGDIICVGESLEECQEALAAAVHVLIESSIFPIVIGGGHDIAYGHFNGIHRAVNQENGKIGIINFDAHFDLRPSTNTTNSGTPFYQILSEHQETTDYLAIGIQAASNTPSLFNLANQFAADYILIDQCEMNNATAILNRLQAFLSDKDYIYITIDIDGIASAFAPGSSAPSPLGFTPRFLFHCLDYLMRSNKVISCDIAEFNPSYDQDGVTANLVARIVDHIVKNLP